MVLAAMLMKSKPVSAGVSTYSPPSWRSAFWCS